MWEFSPIAMWKFFWPFQLGDSLPHNIHRFTDGHALLLAAAKRGDLQRVNELLNRGANPCIAHSWWKYTALCYAVVNGHIAVVERLLKHNNDLHKVRVHYGCNNPLCLALQREDPNKGAKKALVELLLKYGADVTAKTDGGCNALCYAVIDGDIEIVQLIWNKYGANTNIVDTMDDDHYTLLHLAAMFGKTAVVQLLLEAGAQVNAITRRAVVNKDRDYGVTALHIAVKGGHIKVVKMLLESGANVNALTAKWNNTPLCLASKKGHNKVVELLLKCDGVDLNIATREWVYTALHWAVVKNRVEVAQLLLKAGANINAKSMLGYTPRDFAGDYNKLCGGGYNHILKLLTSAQQTQMNLEASNMKVGRAAKRQRKN